MGWSGHIALIQIKIELIRLVGSPALLAKTARAELKRYAAGLAVALAERKIRANMTDDARGALVEKFVRDLPTPAPASKVQSI